MSSGQHECTTTGGGRQRSDARRRQKNRTVRLAILAVVAIGLTVLSVWHQRGGLIKPVGVDALCPFGGIETLWSLIAAGSIIQKVAASSVVLLIMAMVTALIFGRTFCGYLCPLGALQEFVGKLRRLLGIKSRAVLPAAMDRYARWLKYVVLAIVVLWSWSAASLVIRAFDPWVAWTHLTSVEVIAEFSVGLGILVVALVASVAYDRFFCKYLCPMGAFLALLKPLSFFRVQRDLEACTSCGACDRACPMNITVSATQEVRSAECISCNECVNACPVGGALTVGRRSGDRVKTISVKAMIVAVLAITALGIGGASVAGLFQWTMPTAAEALSAPSGGSVDAEQIKGSMSMAEVASAAGIAPAEFTQRFGVKTGDLTRPMKEITSVYGFDVEEVREFVEQRAGADATDAP